MNEDELRAYEDKVRHQAAPDLRHVLSNLHGALTVVYTAVVGDTRTPLDPQAADTIRRQFAATLDGLRENIAYGLIRQRLRDAARRAIVEGAASTGLDVQVSPVTPLDVRWALRDLTAGLRADLADAANLVRHGKLESYADLIALSTAARKAANRLDRASSWIVHRAHNEGISRAVDKAASQGVEISMVWSAESGACIACTSYAGSIARVGDSFMPVVDVADDSARPRGLVWTPPLHPACRCALEPWTGAIGDDLRRTDRPLILRRAAQLAIASGKAAGSEPARVRAADRLLDVADALLIPKRARKAARRAVARKGFRRRG
jgi:hypothetical protein